MRTKLLFLMLTTSLFSAPNIEKIKNDVSVLEKNNQNITSNITRGKANTSEDVIVTDSSGTEISFDMPPSETPPPKVVIPQSKDVLYFNLLQNFEKGRDAIALTPVKPIKNNSFSLKPNENLKASSNSSITQESVKNSRVSSFKGFCQFDNVYDISQQTEANIPCKIDGKIMILNLSLIPDNSNFQLTGVPNFLLIDEFNNGDYSKRIIIDPSLSFVKNSSRTSMNIATYYDSRNIEKLSGLAVKEVSSSLAKGTQQTFDEYKNSNTKENVSYDQHGNAIVIKDTQKPDIINNVAYATVEGVFRVIEKGVEMLNIESLPALYQIARNSVISVELYSKSEEVK